MGREEEGGKRRRKEEAEDGEELQEAASRPARTCQTGGRMASASAAALSGRGAQNLLQFLRLRVPRTGWVYRNVQSPESVSDHMYRMAIMALVTKDEHLNKDRCIRLALVHDMAECIVGDIAPADNIPKEEKHRREEVSVDC
uniref:HD domain containing 2 n=1 Tax=Felis catus TaxID=9685 RepID=A0ABI7XGV5_FELCA